MDPARKKEKSGKLEGGRKEAKAFLKVGFPEGHIYTYSHKHTQSHTHRVTNRHIQ